MRKIITPLTALIVAAGVAACGNSGSGNATAASGSSTAAGSSGSVSATVTAPTTSTAQSGSASNAHQVAAQAEQILHRLSSITAQLASGQLTLSQAKPQLQEVRTQAQALVQNAKQMGSSSPARGLVMMIGNRLAAYAGQVNKAQVTAQGKQALQHSSRALNNLETQVRGLASQAKMPSLNQITSDLQALQAQANG